MSTDSNPKQILNPVFGQIQGTLIWSSTSPSVSGHIVWTINFYWQKFKTTTRKELCDRIYDLLTALLYWQNLIIMYCFSGNRQLPVKFALFVKTGLRYKMPSCRMKLHLVEQYTARPVWYTANSRTETQPQYYLFSSLFRAPKLKYICSSLKHKINAKKSARTLVLTDSNPKDCVARKQSFSEFIQQYCMIYYFGQNTSKIKQLHWIYFNVTTNLMTIIYNILATI